MLRFPSLALSISISRSKLQAVLTYLEDTLRRKVIFLTGKGGVGKSSLCAATALIAKQAGRKVALVSWDPSGDNQPPSLAAALGLDWIGLETLSAFREYALQTIRSERLYDSLLDNQVLRTFVRAAPGLADAVVAGKIWDLYSKGRHDLLLVDLPSSGHAISFFKSPLGLKSIFKSGFIARDTERVCSLFTSPDCRLDLVALPEELPLIECHELKRTLASLHAFSFGFLYLNQVFPNGSNWPPTLSGTSGLPFPFEPPGKRTRRDFPFSAAERSASSESAPFRRT